MNCVTEYTYSYMHAIKKFYKILNACVSSYMYCICV